MKLCGVQNRAIAAFLFQIKNHEYNCPNMERSCPLSEIEYTVNYDERLRGDKIAELKNKIEKTLIQCKGVKVTNTMKTCIIVNTFFHVSFMLSCKVSCFHVKYHVYFYSYQLKHLRIT